MFYLVQSKHNISDWDTLEVLCVCLYIHRLTRAVAWPRESEIAHQYGTRTATAAEVYSLLGFNWQLEGIKGSTLILF